MQYQQTIAAEVVVIGQALHSGAPVSMRILPLPEDTGIFFRRSDLPGRPEIKAEVGNIIDTRKSMALGGNGWRIATIEHLMAVFHGLNIDNAMVEVDGDELPRGDGSGRYFAERILAAGLVTQQTPRRYLRLVEPVWMEGTVSNRETPSKAMIIALPGDELEICFTFTSDHRATGTQYFHFTLAENNFIKEIAPARTIAFTREIEYLRSQGLARSEDLNCAVIVGDDGYRNELRFPEEIVRHKILDILGDLYLLGPLKAKIVAIRSGHSLDLELARKILNNTGIKVGI